MRILALVPARGGSKRLPGKNIRLFHGKPLLAWSVDAAHGAPRVCDILVSTDDPDIADVARSAGALVPWLRPGELATDTATSVDVALHALSWYEEDLGPVDGLLLLQPTSPFRTRASIASAISLFSEVNPRGVVSVAPAKDHPYWCYKVAGDAMEPFIQTCEGLRSQDLPPAFALTGSIYLTNAHRLKAERTFVAPDSVPLITAEWPEAVDIDTEADWNQAVALGRPTL